MKVLGKNVLVEETLLKKDSQILHIEEKPENSMVYQRKLKILDLGPECPTDYMKPGDIPVVTNWSEPSFVKVVEGEQGDYKIVRHLIFNYELIIAIDNEA